MKFKSGDYVLSGAIWIPTEDSQIKYINQIISINNIHGDYFYNYRELAYFDGGWCWNDGTSKQNICQAITNFENRSKFLSDELKAKFL